MPTLAWIVSMAPSLRPVEIEERMASAMLLAFAGLAMFGSMTANSSPPSRAIIWPSLSRAQTRVETVCSTLSPAAWP